MIFPADQPESKEAIFDARDTWYPTLLDWDVWTTGLVKAATGSAHTNIMFNNPSISLYNHTNHALNQSHQFTLPAIHPTTDLHRSIYSPTPFILTHLRIHSPTYYLPIHTPTHSRRYSTST
ncbi:hypothetical protein E2C01_004647 [Portunus trituberculatus]|uniref:Uncharacterized protein n=1 Tax=Portunus trituberculatus TaxID=210409 RepID=A0A5B7CSW1_PORTR|nr:hypothetical protein [Portunus trituberculatus]